MSQRPAADAALAGLTRACTPIVAPGGDPRVAAAVLGWSVRPRRTPDALRRACRDDAGEGRCPAERILAATAGAVHRDDVRAAAEVVRWWQGAGVRVAAVGDPHYPDRLAEGWPDTDAPTLVAWRGAPPGTSPAVAIVGSRRATGYGTAIAAWLAEAAAGAGARVVSGGAVGIDAAAHEAALALPGGTTVVLGCGHAVGYPRPHARQGGLFDRLLDHGGTLLSELLPWEPPRAGQVRARNRIVATLADVVVVVEGRDGSGALLTAGTAAERGRPVLAVPGDVRAPGSAAPHQLLAEGAAPCTGPADLLDAIGAAAPADRAEPGGAPATTTLPAAVHAALAAAWPRPVRLDELAATTGEPVHVLLAALTRARVVGEVAEGIDGVRLRRDPAR